MRKLRIDLIKNIQLIFFLSMVIFCGLFLVLQISSYRDKFKKQSTYIQINYKEEQKTLIKREVERVVGLVKIRMSQLESTVDEIARDKVAMAYSVAENIYLLNKDSKTKSEISTMINDALRRIRFESGLGYFFITDYEGLAVLNANNPELEGHNQETLQDADGKFIIQDMIQLAKKSGGGLYKYFWSKPGEEGNRHEKISYIRHFEPYDWIIGSGLYVQDVEERIKADLLELISTIRFGREGYIFVNTLDAYALVSNGELMPGDQLLWDVIDSLPQRTKDLFSDEYAAAMKENGDYIYYNIQKLSDSTVTSPKVSFIYGLPEINWLIGAGVYLDNVDREITVLREISLEELKWDIGKTIGITILLLVLFLSALLLLGRRLQRDFYLFTEFFDKAVCNDAEIDLQKVRFSEMISMAERANRMQRDKFRTQNELIISENKFRLLAENSKDMIFRINYPDRKYDYISPASMEILGYSPAEIQNKPNFFDDIIHPEWKDYLKEVKDNIYKGFPEDILEYPIINKNGEEIWINQRNNYMRNEEGGIIALVGRISDVTKRKVMEEKLSQSARMDAIGQLAGGISHDFNNVLAGIINAAQVLKSPKRDLDEKAVKMVDLIMNAAVRAADLTAKLTSFSRKKTQLMKAQDAHHIIMETVEILKRTIDKKISLKMELNAKRSVVVGDGSELQSIILNLGINASHAMVDGGVLSICTANKIMNQHSCDKVPFDVIPGEYIQVEVRDSGQGISLENIDRIFEPFFSTKETGKGTGLGLATVYTAIEHHKGLIDVQSQIGKGTSFFFLLPCSSEHPQLKAKRIKQEPQSGKILLVDDEEIIRSAFKSMLEDVGYTVLTAAEGKEAITIYKKISSEIDVVILDVLMPEMSGLEAFHKMKKIDENSNIILISGLKRNQEIEDLFKMGLKGFLKKPFTDEDLLEILQATLKELV